MFNMEDLFVATMNIGNVACIEALANTAGKHANSSKVGDFIISLGQPAVLVQEEGAIFSAAIVIMVATINVTKKEKDLQLIDL